MMTTSTKERCPNCGVCAELIQIDRVPGIVFARWCTQCASQYRKERSAVTETVIIRPSVREDDCCTWCNSEHQRVIVFDEGDYDNAPAYVCAECLQLGLDTLQETPATSELPAETKR